MLDANARDLKRLEILVCHGHRHAYYKTRKEAKQRQQDFVLRKTKVLKPKTLAIAIVAFQNK